MDNRINTLYNPIINSFSDHVFCFLFFYFFIFYLFFLNLLELNLYIGGTHLIGSAFLKFILIFTYKHIKRKKYLHNNEITKAAPPV